MSKMSAAKLFSCAVYIAVLIFGALFIFKSIFGYRRGARADGDRPAALILAGAGVLTVTSFFLLTGKILSGNYAVHLAFSFCPAFTVRLLHGRFRADVIVAAVVFTSVAVSVAFSFLRPVSVDMAVAELTAVCGGAVFLLGREIRRISGRLRRPDGAASVLRQINAIVDILYFLALLFLMGAGRAAVGLNPMGEIVLSAVCAILICALAAAMHLRVLDGRMFLFSREREDRFTEACRLNYGSGEGAGANVPDNCEAIFMRVREYFERKKPFLDPNLTLDKVAKTLLTNKQYLSNTVNVCTGKNFCQFVNYYRVRYSVDLFRSGQATKIVDMAMKSGFRTVHSFTMAFRINMNLSPSQWCRVNRNMAGTMRRTKKL